VFCVYEGEARPHPEPEDSRVVSVCLPTTLVQRLDRGCAWHTPHRRRPPPRNAALRAALGDWLDQHEQLAGLLDPESRRRQCRAASDSLPPSPDGVSIPRLRRLLQWPRERFDAVLEALRAPQAIDLEPLPAQTGDAQALYDSSQVHGHCYGRLRWRV
jgi:hypothetical protein